MTNIVVFGDSIAWGSYDDKRGGWVERLKLDLASRDIDVYNCAVSGDTTEYLLKRFEIETVARLDETETIIIFAIGINDSKFLLSKKEYATIKSIFEKNILSLYTRAKKFTNKIIFIGLTRVDDSKTTPVPWNKDEEYRASVIKEYDSIIQKVCRVNKIRYLFMLELLNSGDLYDGLHPNARGHEKLFIEVEKFLKQEKFI